MISLKVMALLVICLATLLPPSYSQYQPLLLSGPSLHDSLSPAEKIIDLNLPKSEPSYNPSFRAFVIPGVLISYGITSLKYKGLKNFNDEVKYEVYTESLPDKITIDNYLQFAPAAAVYGLNALGIKGKHNFRDRSMIYLISNCFLNSTVIAGKKICRQLRPDGSAYSSFPSGHTAEAFASAEFMWQEYRDVSPIFGIAGYAMAATTGYLRMYNNKHWFSDVVTGAGIGILSTKLAYLIYPVIQHHLFKDRRPGTMLMPTLQNNAVGLALVAQPSSLFGSSR